MLKVFSASDCAVNDNPMPENVESAAINIVSVRLRSQGGDWYSKDLSATPLNFDLGDLGCSIWKNFSKFRVPAGTYDHLRLETEETGLVTHTDDSTYPLKVPSGEQTGIKIFFDPPLVVSDDQVTVCILKYDRSNSIQAIPPPAPNLYHFKPVVRAVCGDPISIDPDDGDPGAGDPGAGDPGTGDPGTNCDDPETSSDEQAAYECLGNPDPTDPGGEIVLDPGTSTK
jgi:hypothetical protein